MKQFLLFAAATFIILAGCKNLTDNSGTMEGKTPSVKEENVTYSLDTVTMHGIVAYNEAASGKRPVVIVVHEWWGINDYIRSRVKQLASMGYIAMAADLYGNGQTADDPAAAGKLAGPFYKDPIMAKERFDAALEKIKSYPVADTSRIAAIGYCFGGGMVLNFARMGEDLNGVVSFHGSLLGVPADKSKLKADILVCHGEDDKFVKPEEVTQFKKQLDSIGASYTFKSYPGATHAFSNPGATEKGEKFDLPIAYNAEADTSSFNEMKMFFDKIFR